MRRWSDDAPKGEDITALRVEESEGHAVAAEVYSRSVLFVAEDSDSVVFASFPRDRVLAWAKALVEALDPTAPKQPDPPADAPEAPAT